MPPIYNNPSFWEEKYEKDQAGWDTGNANPIFLQLIKKNHFFQPGKILIVGAGKGYDAIEASKNGFDVTAIDFSAKAISFAEELAKQNNLKINFLVEDIFNFNEKFLTVLTLCMIMFFIALLIPKKE